MLGIPEKWVTAMDELYIIEKMAPEARALATSTSEKSGAEIDHVLSARNSGLGRGFVVGPEIFEGSNLRSHVPDVSQSILGKPEEDDGEQFGLVLQFFVHVPTDCP
jgi:hypothetical protein